MAFLSLMMAHACLWYLGIAKNSESWPTVERQLKRKQPGWGVKLKVKQAEQTYPTIVQLARHGFGHGLVSLRIAKNLRIKDSQLVRFPKPGISVPVSLVGRRTTLARPIVQKFYESLIRHLPQES